MICEKKAYERADKDCLINIDHFKVDTFENF